MSVNYMATSGPTANNGINTKIRRYAASAQYLEYSAGTNLSYSDILENHYIPDEPPFNQSIGSLIDASTAFRTCRLQGDTTSIDTIGISSPTDLAFVGWDSVGECNDTDEEYFYAKAISYDTHTNITFFATLNYGYSFFKWRNGGSGGTQIGSSNTLTMDVNDFLLLTDDLLWVGGV